MIYPSNWVEIQNEGFILVFQLVFSSITLWKPSCIFECFHEFILEKVGQNTILMELETEVIYTCASVLEVMTMENAKWQAARLETARDLPMKCFLPPFNSLSFSRGGELLAGIKSWTGYIKSFIHHTSYSASVSDQSLLKIFLLT